MKAIFSSLISTEEYEQQTSVRENLTLEHGPAILKLNLRKSGIVSIDFMESLIGPYGMHMDLTQRLTPEAGARIGQFKKSMKARTATDCVLTRSLLPQRQVRMKAPLKSSARWNEHCFSHCQ
jgi:hypothetical protein